MTVTATALDSRLHDYQVEAVEYLQTHPKAGLFLQMGLGKTAITLSALTEEHLPVLVTAPKRVAEHVWTKEVQVWRPDLTVKVASGSPAKRADVLQSGADIIVIGRDNLADAVPYADTFRTFVMDELSSFKTKSTQRWKAARKITRASTVDHVWGLTGTPSPNGLLDLWAQVYLLDGGERLGATLGQYRSRYFTPGRQLANGVITEWILRPGSDKAIHRKLEDLCLSMGERIHIPTTYNTVEVPLSPQTRKVYKQMKNDLVAELEILGGETHTASSAAVMSAKLSQITAGFMYVDDADIRSGEYTRIHTEKMSALREIVEGTGSPVLVFYRFRAELDLLKEEFGSIGHTMDEPDIVDRWNAGQVPVLFAHPASAGHGLNLQHGGHTVVWTSTTWSLEEHQQANKRLARQGQKNPVVIHYLVSPGTIDTAVQMRLSEKKTVQQALLDHLESSIT